jgi:chromate transport protein ChrA
MLRYLGRKADKPAVKSAIRSVTLAAAGLVVVTTVPLARDALTGALPIAIAAGSFLVLVLTKRSTIWVIAAAALAGFAGAWLR